MPSKRILILFFGIILSIIIFKITFNSKIDYLALGDDLSIGRSPFNTYGKSFVDYFSLYLEQNDKLKTFNKEFIEKNHRTTDLISDIDNNKKKYINDKEISINQLLLSADLITISTGINEMFYKLTYDNIKKNQINTIYEYIDELFIDIDTLIKRIRKINNCEIYFIGFYNPFRNLNSEENIKTEKIYEYIDKKFNNLESYKNIKYVSIYEGFKEKEYYLPNKKVNFPSLEGYNYISNKLISKFSK